MIKETITWNDYEGNEHTEDFHFHITDSQRIKMEITNDGLKQRIEDIVAAGDNEAIYNIFKKTLIDAAGKKIGAQFVNSDEVKNNFAYSGACDALLLRLFTDPNPEKTMADFIAGILPTGVADKAGITTVPAPQA